MSAKSNLKLFIEKRAVSVNEKQCVDTGLLMSVITILLGLYTDNHIYPVITLILVFLTMLVPKVYYLFAVIWFGITRFLGVIILKVLLCFIYFMLVTPVGLFRRITGKDQLNLNNFKRDTASVFKIRNHIYNEWDFKNMF